MKKFMLTGLMILSLSPLFLTNLACVDQAHHTVGDPVFVDGKKLTAVVTKYHDPLAGWVISTNEIQSDVVEQVQVSQQVMQAPQQVFVPAPTQQQTVQVPMSQPVMQQAPQQQQVYVQQPMLQQQQIYMPPQQMVQVQQQMAQQPPVYRNVQIVNSNNGHGPGTINTAFNGAVGMSVFGLSLNGAKFGGNATATGGTAKAASGSTSAAAANAKVVSP